MQDFVNFVTNCFNIFRFNFNFVQIDDQEIRIKIHINHT